MNIVLIVTIYLILQMTLVWVIYRLSKNPSVVDGAWSIGLMASGLIYLCAKPMTPRLMVLAGLLVLWALRLAGYLWYTRIRHGHVDKRYTELSAHWKINQSLGFFLNFQLQGLLIGIISGLFYFVSSAQPSTLTAVDTVAIVLVGLGIVGESVADWQLHNFKQHKQGGVCNIGLWYYSRHPNYFFDLVTWLGFAFFSLQSPKGYLSLVSLSLLYIIFTRITGPLTERGSVQSRGQAYLDYQQQTSFFFPWFKAIIKPE